jgi:hypothetical protein
MTVALFLLRQVRRSQTAATDQKRMGDRAVYCARLESVCAERHPGFESPPIRHLADASELPKNFK